VPEPAIKEVARYLQESFGNQRRIDYGTGHEANFMAWL
jgi:serine/threonine-protein phosphatase 2A activator